MALTINNYIDRFLEVEKDNADLCKRISDFREDIGAHGDLKVGGIGGIIITRTRVTGMTRHGVLKHIITLASWNTHVTRNVGHVVTMDDTKIVLLDHKIKIGDADPVTVERVVVGVSGRRSAIQWFCEVGHSSAHSGVEELSAKRADSRAVAMVKSTSGASTSKGGGFGDVYGRAGRAQRPAYVPPGRSTAPSPNRAPDHAKKHGKKEKKGHPHKKMGANPYSSAGRGNPGDAERARITAEHERSRAQSRRTLAERAAMTGASAAEVVKDAIDDAESSTEEVVESAESGVDYALDSDAADRIRALFSGAIRYHMASGRIECHPGAAQHGNTFISANMDRVRRFVAESIGSDGPHYNPSFTGDKASHEGLAFQFFGRFNVERDMLPIRASDIRVMESIEFISAVSMMVSAFNDTIRERMATIGIMMDENSKLEERSHADEYPEKALSVAMYLAGDVFNSPMNYRTDVYYRSLMSIGMYIAHTAWGGIRRSLGDMHYPGHVSDMAHATRKDDVGRAVSEIRRDLIMTYAGTMPEKDQKPYADYIPTPTNVVSELKKTMYGVAKLRQTSYTLDSIKTLLMIPSMGGMYRIIPGDKFVLNTNAAGIMCIFGLMIAKLSAEKLGGLYLEVFKKFLGNMGNKPMYVEGDQIVDADAHDEIVFQEYEKDAQDAQAVKEAGYANESQEARDAREAQVEPTAPEKKKKKWSKPKTWFGDQRPLMTGNCACTETCTCSFPGFDSDADTDSDEEPGSTCAHGSIPRREDPGASSFW